VQETLEYASAINHCYRRQSLALQARVPSILTCAVARAITESLNPVAEQCILNQNCGFWLLSDALVSAMLISTKLTVEVNRCKFVDSPLVFGNQDSELDILYKNIAGVAVDVLAPF
jgi:hypothetical protein